MIYVTIRVHNSILIIQIFIFIIIYLFIYLFFELFNNLTRRVDRFVINHGQRNFCISASSRQLKKQLEFHENKFYEFQVSKLVLKQV